MSITHLCALILAGVVLSGCVSSEQISGFRDDVAELRDQLEADERRWAEAVGALDSTDPFYPQAVSRLRRAEADLAAADALVNQTDALLAEADNPTNPINSLIGVLAPWIPEPARIPLLLGGALAASITRAGKLKNGLRSVAKSIDKARRRDPEFASRFALHADLLRSTQTPTAMKVIDRAQRDARTKTAA